MLTSLDLRISKTVITPGASYGEYSRIKHYSITQWNNHQIKGNTLSQWYWSIGTLKWIKCYLFKSCAVQPTGAVNSNVLNSEYNVLRYQICNIFSFQMVNNSTLFNMLSSFHLQKSVNACMMLSKALLIDWFFK